MAFTAASFPHELIREVFLNLDRVFSVRFSHLLLQKKINLLCSRLFADGTP